MSGVMASLRYAQLSKRPRKEPFEEQKRPAYFSVPQGGVEYSAMEGSVAEGEAREFSRVGVLVLYIYTYIMHTHTCNYM